MPENHWRILHLADLHFASPGTNYLDDNKIKLKPALRENIVHAFHEDLRSGSLKSSAPFDAIVLSGDVTTQGMAEGFTKFRDETAPIVQGLLGEGGRMFLVPGNHDVKWKHDPTLADHFDVKFADFRALVERVGAVTSLIPTGNAGSREEKLNFLQPGTPLTIDAERGLAVLCLNSSIRCGEIDESLQGELRGPIERAQQLIGTIEQNLKGRLDDKTSEAIAGVEHQLKMALRKVEEKSLFDPSHVTQSQLERLRALIEQERGRRGGAGVWDDSLRVAVLHHPLMPFPEQMTELKAFESMLDASRVLDFLAEFRFHLVLCGHKHQPYVLPRRTIDGTEFLIVGGPTVAGGCPADSPRGYQVIDVERNGSKFQVKVADRPIAKGKNGAGGPPPKVYNFIDGRNRPAFAGFCAEWATSPAITRLDVDAKADNSDEFMIFVQVESCARARAAVLDYFRGLPGRKNKNERQMKFWGVYDAYGEYDLIVRGEAPGWSSRAIKQITEELEEHRPQKGAILRLNIRGARSLDGSRDRNVISASQDDYRLYRWYKVFIVIHKSSDVEDDDVTEVLDLLHKGLAKGGPHQLDGWALFWSEHAIVVEGLIKCGQYYRLGDVTHEIEKFADETGRDKLTHIAYHHEEWVNGRDGDGTVKKKLSGRTVRDREKVSGGKRAGR